MYAFRAILFFSALLSASAGATSGDIIPGARYPSARGMALGQSMLANGDTTQEAIFYNPANLGRVGGFHIEPFNFSFQENTHLMKGLGLDSAKFTDLAKYKQNLLDDPNSLKGGSISFFPNFSFGGFAAGALYQSRVSGEADNVGNIHYRSLYQLIPTAGYGLRLASGVLKVGYVVQYVSQSSGDRTVPSSTVPLGYNQSIQQGAGLSHNLGMNLTLPYVYQPSFQLVARNIAGLHFTGKPLAKFAQNPSGTPDAEKMSVDLGAAYLWHWGSGIELRNSFTYRDFTNSSSTSRLLHLATGFDFGFNEKIFLRFGFASAYPDIGFGLRVGRGRFDLAWYSEEIGGGLRHERDTRYGVQFLIPAF